MKPTSHQSPIYHKYHVRPIINAAGSVTKFGGSRTRKEALEAMEQASKTLVDLADLNEKAGEVIARITKSPAGFVSNGAASGLILQAAAVIAGADPIKMAQLPQTKGLKNQIIIQTMHRFPYDQSYRAAGAELVTIGSARRTATWELEGAINERTAAVAFLFSPFTARTGLTLPQVSEIALTRGIPVIVDAASMVPPRENLTKYVKMGADLVSISGGKGIRGPQGSGLLFGRKDLVDAVSANASPNQFLGRGMKVSKEQIIGFLTALEVFIQEDEEAEMNEYRRKAQQITDALIEIPGMAVSVKHDEHDFIIPSTLITFDRSWTGRTKEDILSSLASGDPPVQLQSIFLPEDQMAVDPFNVDNEELEVLIRRLREELLKSDL